MYLNRFIDRTLMDSRPYRPRAADQTNTGFGFLFILIPFSFSPRTFQTRPAAAAGAAAAAAAGEQHNGEEFPQTRTKQANTCYVPVNVTYLDVVKALSHPRVIRVCVSHYHSLKSLYLVLASGTNGRYE